MRFVIVVSNEVDVLIIFLLQIFDIREGRYSAEYHTSLENLLQLFVVQLVKKRQDKFQVSKVTHHVRPTILLFVFFRCFFTFMLSLLGQNKFNCFA